MPRKQQPIGIFDSGLGGLTVFKAIRELLPNENLIYFGDTAHVPYGSKSADTVAQYSLEIARFLVEQNVKLIVIACNTATALAMDALRKEIKVPIIGVIDPGVEAALNATKGKKIGIIATEATIRSHSYRDKIKHADGSVRVIEVPCPLFAPIVEEGWWKKEATYLVAKEYLGRLKEINPDVLVLGCTHYPTIKEVIQETVGKNVFLVDSGHAVARAVYKKLEEEDLLRPRGKADIKVYASDDPARFKRLARHVLAYPLHYVELKKLS